MGQFIHERTGALHCLSRHDHLTIRYAHAHPAAFTQLSNFTGQWNISTYLTKFSDKNVFTLHSCNDTDPAAACQQPGMNPDANDKVKVQFSFSGKLRTLNGATPKTAVVKFCFTRPFFTDRPWRKYNNVIDVSGRRVDAAFPAARAHVPPRHVAPWFSRASRRLHALVVPSHM
jgi:hypothetical protein